MENPWGNETQYFFNLNSDIILKAIDELGYRTRNWCLPYHCFENRVYEIGIEFEGELKRPSDEFIVAKFYRPGRWSREQILEEHEFLFELQEIELGVVEPIKINGESLFSVLDGKIHFALFQKVGGRNHHELSDHDLERLGRTLARLHNVGRAKKFKHRLELNPSTYGHTNLNYFLENNLIPENYKKSYEEICRTCLVKIEERFKSISPIRTHGDFHLGNILFRDPEVLLVDFDDSISAPEAQDLWILLGGRDEYSKNQLFTFLDSYATMGEDISTQIPLFETLRTLRLIHYSGWLARRMDDPIFKQTFVSFYDESYWRENIQDLEGQLRFL